MQVLAKTLVFFCALGRRGNALGWVRGSRVGGGRGGEGGPPFILGRVLVGHDSPNNRKNIFLTKPLITFNFFKLFFFANSVVGNSMFSCRIPSHLAFPWRPLRQCPFPPFPHKNTLLLPPQPLGISQRNTQEESSKWRRAGTESKIRQIRRIWILGRRKEQDIYLLYMYICESWRWFIFHSRSAYILPGRDFFIVSLLRYGASRDTYSTPRFILVHLCCYISGQANPTNSQKGK